jgi:hypothetical protein
MKYPLWKFIPVLFLCFGGETGVSAATAYYVSASGNNSANGLTPSTPWQTISKVNAPGNGITYQPGDSILFNRGDSWTGTALNTAASGTSSAQITYSAYGTGAAPILDGNGIATLVNINHNFITLDGFQLRNAGTLVNFAGVDGTQLLNQVNKNASSHVFYAGFANTGTTLIDHTTYTIDPGKPGGNNAIEIWADPRQGKTYTITHNIIDRSAASNEPGGLCVVLNGASNSTVRFNTCRRGGQGIGVKPWHDPVSACYCNSSTGNKCPGGVDPATSVKNVNISDNYIDQIHANVGVDGELVEVEGCGTGNLAQQDVTIARNVLVCSTGPQGVGSSDAIGGFFGDRVDVFGNIMLGGCQSGVPSTSNPSMMHLASSSTNWHIHNNTFVGGLPAGDARQSCAICWFPGGTGIAENNIIKSLRLGVGCISCSGGSEDYNIYDTDVPARTSGNITHGTGHSQTISPMFVNASPVVADDVKLQAGSPAIGTGLSLGAPYNLILESATAGPPLSSAYGIYDQLALGWMKGAFGFTATVVVVPLEIKGAIVKGAVVP